MHLSRGFTLIELMIVVAIIAFLSMLAVPKLSRFLAKAKRAEAYMQLSSIYAAQKMYWSEQGTYSSVLQGPGGIGWQSEKQTYYTYGFPGQEGRNYVVGKQGAGSEELSLARADRNSFTAVATAYLLDNQNPDVLTVNEKNEIVVVKDGLA